MFHRRWIRGEDEYQTFRTRIVIVIAVVVVGILAIRVLIIILGLALVVSILAVLLFSVELQYTYRSDINQPLKKKANKGDTDSDGVYTATYMFKRSREIEGWFRFCCILVNAFNTLPPAIYSHTIYNVLLSFSSQ